MAPWPEQGGEPKAPDKDNKRETVEGAANPEVEDTSESAGAAALSDQVPKQPEEKEVLTLDEGQLKALLDEAITYKNPKDREGKSELFKELLQEAEADESDSKGIGNSLTGKLPRGYYNLPAKKKHSRHQGRECGVGVSTTRGGSLQNLHALGMEGVRGGGRNRRSGRSGETLVSARQREGGSLPTNVNVDNESDLDSIICPNYTSSATLEVSGSGKEENMSAEESNPQPLLQGHSLPNGSELPVLAHGSGTNPHRSGTGLIQTLGDERELVKYASSICVGPVETGAMLYPPTPMQHVSTLSIPPPPLHLADPLSRMGLAPFGKDKESDSKIKALDENGNALGCIRLDSSCQERKKRRLKAKNDQKYIRSEDIEGFRGGADIDTLMEYIESPSNVLEGNNKANKTRANQSNGPRNHVKMRVKEEESKQIKRKTKEKFQRCNSLEEISKTKLEDLTEESSTEKVNGSPRIVAKKQVTLDDAQLGKKPSWDNNSDPEKNKMKKHKMDRASSEGIQDSEFHVVTKKQRKKKRRSVCTGQVVSKPVYYETRGFPAHDRTLERDGSSGLLYQYRHGRGDQAGTQPRRKSASSVPPSDKSDSSDLDSVHSLPVSSTTTRTNVGKNSVSGDSTPQASYADIAKTAASPPESSSQGNICRQEKHSPYLSCAGPDLETSSSDTITTVMLPTPIASSLLKKDAMTDTTCDTIKPSLPSEEYPPLETKTADVFIVATVKQAHIDTTVKQAHIDSTVKQAHIDTTVKQAHIDATVKQAHIDATVKQAYIDSTVKQSHTDVTDKQAHIDTTVKQAHIDTTVKHAHIDATVKQADIDATEKQADIDATVKQGDIDATVKQTGIEATVKQDHIDTTVKQAHTDATVKQTNIDTTVKQTGIEATVKQTHMDATVKKAHIDATVKQACSIPLDNNISEEKVISKTVPLHYVIPVSESGNSQRSLPIDMPPSCVNSALANANNKRPAVILMNEPKRNSQISTGLTFGFEVNHTLLQCEDSMCNLNKVLSSPYVASSLSTSKPSPPKTVKDPSLKRLIQFISMGWEDTMKDLRTGRAVYYDGQ